MVNCSVMAGSAPKPPELTWMVATPVPGMLKFMVSAPAVALACWMAALKVHWFPSLKTSMSQVPLAVDDASGESRVSFTVKVVEAWAGWTASMRHAANSVATTIRHAAIIAFFVLHLVPLVLLSIAWIISVFLSFCGGPEALAAFGAPPRRLARRPPSASLSSARCRSRNVSVGLMWWYIAHISFARWTLGLCSSE